MPTPGGNQRVSRCSRRNSIPGPRFREFTPASLCLVRQELGGDVVLSVPFGPAMIGILRSAIAASSGTGTARGEADSCRDARRRRRGLCRLAPRGDKRSRAGEARRSARRRTRAARTAQVSVGRSIGRRTRIRTRRWTGGTAACGGVDAPNPHADRLSAGVQAANAIPSRSRSAMTASMDSLITATIRSISSGVRTRAGDSTHRLPIGRTIRPRAWA